MDHETIDASALSVRDTYQLMTDLVAPRPIAWVSTQAENGRRNLAPFSYFQAVCSHPPMIVIACSWRPDGQPKDPLRNILATGELVVNHTCRTLVDAMNATSGDYPPEIDEWEEVARIGVATLTPLASRHVAPPRIGEAAAALECRLVHAIPLGEGRPGLPSSTLVVAQVVAFHLAAGLLRRDARGRMVAIDPAQLGAVGRLGGIAYTDTSGRFDLARPKPIGSDA